MLQGAVVLVLLIACANLSTLLLSRAESRRREFAVRAALGASFGRLLRQSIAEGCLLSAAGGALGVGLAVAGLRVLVAGFAGALPRARHIALDWRVLAFTVAVALATGIVVGLTPLLPIARDAAAAGLNDGGQRATERRILRRALVVAEVALAVALVAGAGLLLRTVRNLTAVDAGFDRSHLVTFGVSLPTATYTTPAARRRFFDRLVDRLAGTPGVGSVAAMSGLPPLRRVNANTTLFENYTPPPGRPSQDVDYYQAVTSHYLATMRIPVIEGRGLTDGDADGPPVVLVNQTMARTYWPGQSALGHRLKPCCNPAIPWMAIVGVIGDVKQGGVEHKTGTEIYFPAARAGSPTMNVVLRTDLPVEALAGTIRGAMAGLDPTLPVIDLRAMNDVFEQAIGRPRLLSDLLSAFAALAMLLSMVGIYGVLSYMVTERRREIGIRVALGATRGSVMSLVVGHGLRLTGVGIAAGLAAALGAGRLLQSLLFGVSAADPWTLAGVAALIGAVALAACALPGRRATRVDPIVALRAE